MSELKPCTDLPPPLGPVPEVVSAAAHQAELHHEDRHPVPAGTVHGVQISTSPQLTPAPASSSSCLRSLIFLVWPSAAVLAGAGALVLAGPGWRLVSPPRHRAAWPQRPHNLAQSTLRLRTIRRRRHVISMVNTRYIKDDFVLRSSLTIRYMQCVKN